MGRKGKGCGWGNECGGGGSGGRDKEWEIGVVGSSGVGLGWDSN